MTTAALAATRTAAMMATTTVVDDDPSLDVARTGVSVAAVVSALVVALARCPDVVAVSYCER